MEMRTILEANNSEIFLETKGTAYLGVVENGKFILGNAGIEFQYKNLRRIFLADRAQAVLRLRNRRLKAFWEFRPQRTPKGRLRLRNVL